MSNLQQATFGGGCFWCTEAVFLEVKGIKKVVSGYSGGNAPGIPTYREICYISKGGFSFMVSDTNAEGDFATGVPLDNQSVKFVISYGVDISM